MSTKSHRAKALAAQLSTGPTTPSLSSTTQLGDLVPPESLVKPKKKKSSTATGAGAGSSKKVKDGALGSALKGKGKAVEVESEVVGEEEERAGLGEEEDDAEVLVSAQAPQVDADGDATMSDNPPTTNTSSDFAPLTSTVSTKPHLLKAEERRIPIPPHRMTPLKKDWVNIYGPLVEMMGLMVRMNVGRRCVELRVSAREGRGGAGRVCIWLGGVWTDGGFVHCVWG